MRIINHVVSLDNITVVGRVDDAESLTRILNKSIYVTKVRFGNYPWKHNFHMIDGSLLQWAEKGCSPELRLEFNPNKCMKEEIARIMPYIDQKYITRLDVAIDYKGIEISNYIWFPDRKRKRTMFYGKDGKTETIQFGSRASDKMFRLYDKAREQKEPSMAPWTRVEIQRRYDESEETLEEDLFQGLAGFKAEFLDPKLPVKDRGLLCLFYYYPEQYDLPEGGVRKRLNEKYKRILDPLSPNPSNLYRQERTKLQIELDEWLALNPWFDIGKEISL